MSRLHRWGVILSTQGGNSEMSFMHTSPALGTQVWDQQMWPLSPDIRTERAYLAEIYEATLFFMERRA